MQKKKRVLCKSLYEETAYSRIKPCFDKLVKPVMGLSQTIIWQKGINVNSSKHIWNPIVY